MKFEVSERIVTSTAKEDLLKALEEQFKKVSLNVQRHGDTLVAKSIEASFGSINRSDTTTVELKAVDDGFLAVANVNYRPSTAFWIIFIIGIFLWLVGWLVPIIFYLIQKKTVQEGIQEVFIRVKNEFMSPSGQQPMKHGQSDLDQLEKLGALKEKGVITEDEFQAKKKQLLGL
jgi:hypothetical protein